MSASQKPEYVPNKFEIGMECFVIRTFWSDREAEDRHWYKSQVFMVPECANYYEGYVEDTYFKGK